KIMATFRLVADPQVEDLSTESILRYRVKCNILTMSGKFIGAGVGEASSEEEKFKWRFSINENEFESTPENLRRIKYTRDKTIKQIRTNPYDLANTILKIAKKRALIDAVLTVTAASDIFTQDIEEMPEEIINKVEEKSEVKCEASKPSIKEPNSQATDKQIGMIHKICDIKGFDYNHIKEILKVEHLTEINKGAAGRLIEYLQKVDEFGEDAIREVAGQNYLYKGG
ncbi:MAG: hypothetical protein GYA51_03120, partial [Candidatus Methanofastidiosa archaeon]|nr:hypothetical protein [Candidatus Methanofastidiosa archaeon]